MFPTLQLLLAVMALTALAAPAPDTALAATESAPPGRPALDIIHLGPGVFTDEAGQMVPAGTFERELRARMLAPEGRRLLEAGVLAFFRQIAATHPELAIQVADPAQPRLLGDSLDRTAFASVALSRAVVTEAAYSSGETDRTYYAAMPLLLVSARSFELLYARPVFVQLKSTHGVNETNTALLDRTLAAVAQFLRQTAADTNTAAIAATCLQEGSFGQPGAFTYAMETDAIRFQPRLSPMHQGFQHPEQVADLLRFAICSRLARRERVYPPMDAPLAARNLRGVAARYYGLGVVTDVRLETGLPRGEGGLVVLPVRRPEADFQLHCQVTTRVEVESRTQHFVLGRCDAGLAVSRTDGAGASLPLGGRGGRSGFRASVSQTNHLADDRLLQCLLAITSDWDGPGAPAAP